jgi:hypothetical protein
MRSASATRTHPDVCGAHRPCALELVAQCVANIAFAPFGELPARLLHSRRRWTGPLFFAVANRLDDVLSQFTIIPQVFILSGLRQQPREILAQMGLEADGHALWFAENFAEAPQLAAASVEVA